MTRPWGPLASIFGEIRDYANKTLLNCGLSRIIGLWLFLIVLAEAARKPFYISRLDHAPVTGMFEGYTLSLYSESLNLNFNITLSF